MKFINAREEEYVPEKYLSFDDILLVPQHSFLASRRHPWTETIIGKNSILSIPIIASPMDTICGSEMAIELYKLGGLGILHRYHSSLEIYKQLCKTVFDNTEGNFGISIGLNDRWFSFLEEIEKMSVMPKLVCLDVAHGFMEKALEFIAKIRKRFPTIDIMSGSISTTGAAEANINAGTNILRVGIGGGSLCTTRIVTGHGMPTFSSVYMIAKYLKKSGYKATIIADGGIRNSGDCVKALAAGADAVMLGKLLAGSNEAPGEVIERENCFTYGGYKVFYKKYRGQSSKAFQEVNGLLRDGVTAEGEDTYVNCIGPVADRIKELMGGIRSGMSYSGAGSLKKLRDDSLAIEVGHNVLVESQPHGK